MKNQLQNSLTVITRIKEGHAPELRKLLLQIGEDIKGKRDNKDFLFASLPTTHFARWVIIDNDRNLVFSSTFDGPRDPYVDLMIEHGCAALDRIYRHCEGYNPPAELNQQSFSAAFKPYFMSHNYEYQAMFFAYPRVTVQQVRLSNRIRHHFEHLIDVGFTDAFIDLILKIPRSNPGSGLVNRIRAAVLWVIRQVLDILGDLLNFVFTLLGGAFSRKPPAPVKRAYAPINIKASKTERGVVQNEMTIITAIAKSRFNWKLHRLRIILGLLNAWNSRFSDGTLAGITTIHFMRWLIYDNGEGPSMYFESNYDGNWPLYLDDFYDKAGSGVALIWGNTADWPPGGVNDMESFKAAIYTHQTRAQVFYSSYPKDTAKNILNNLAITNQLGLFLSQEIVNDWLRRF